MACLSDPLLENTPGERRMPDPLLPGEGTQCVKISAGKAQRDLLGARRTDLDLQIFQLMREVLDAVRCPEGALLPITSKPRQLLLNWHHRPRLLRRQRRWGPAPPALGVSRPGPPKDTGEQPSPSQRSHGEPAFASPATTPSQPGRPVVAEHHRCDIVSVNATFGEVLQAGRREDEGPVEPAPAHTKM